ncbi:hypothetical protein LZ31DRAFT_56374 [Colletotrichum somersetense]|nr:hypothetical protein LZ31DRAFT_56374 [Colletotrichum somersetense]
MSTVIVACVHVVQNMLISMVSPGPPWISMHMRLCRAGTMRHRHPPMPATRRRVMLLHPWTGLAALVDDCGWRQLRCAAVNTSDEAESRRGKAKQSRVRTCGWGEYVYRKADLPLHPGSRVLTVPRARAQDGPRISKPVFGFAGPRDLFPRITCRPPAPYYTYITDPQQQASWEV